MAIKDYVDRAKADYDKVFEAGKKSEYDKLWDAFQGLGNRANYIRAFSGNYWNNENFKPKYPIKPSDDASYMFDNTGLTDFDFVEKGIVLDISKATSVTYMFRNAKGIKRIGIFDCYTSRKNVNRPFYGCCIETIDEFVSYDDTVYVSTFRYATELKNITMSGVIASNSLSFGSCTLLSKDSLYSIINCLSNETDGLSIELSLQAVNKAFETSTDANDGSTSSEWLTLTGTKSNWTISLV